jgi:hypothetical protein
MRALRTAVTLFLISPLIWTGYALLTDSRASSAQTTLVKVDGVTLAIPADIPFTTYENKVADWQAVSLLIRPSLLHVDFVPPQGHRKEFLNVVLQSEKDQRARLSGYERFTRDQAPAMLGPYRVYKIDGAESLYVYAEGTIPLIVVCHPPHGGVLADTPRLCDAWQEFSVFTQPNTETARRVTLEMNYGFVFDDLSNIPRINEGIVKLVSSLVVTRDP